METKICVVCGAEFESKTKRQTCSEVCRHKLTQSKIDHKESAKKAKLTNLERYGADNIMKLPEGKEKFKASMMRMHGVEHARQIPELREASVKMNGKPLTSMLGAAKLQTDLACLLGSPTDSEHHLLL